jgi:predicted trehalose synthase
MSLLGEAIKATLAQRTVDRMANATSELLIREMEAPSEESREVRNQRDHLVKHCQDAQRIAHGQDYDPDRGR